MKTHEIMNVIEYPALGGPIEAVPTCDVRAFCQRILDRMADIQNYASPDGAVVTEIQSFENEIKQTMERL